MAVASVVKNNEECQAASVMTSFLSVVAKHLDLHLTWPAWRSPKKLEHGLFAVFWNKHYFYMNYCLIFLPRYGQQWHVYETDVFIPCACWSALCGCKLCNTVSSWKVKILFRGQTQKSKATGSQFRLSTFCCCWRSLTHQLQFSLWNLSLQPSF